MKDLVNILVLVLIFILTLLIFNARTFIRSRIKIDNENSIVKNLKGICIFFVIILLTILKYLN